MRAMLWLVLLAATLVHAENGHDAWLRYAPIDDPQLRAHYEGVLPAVVVTFGDSEVVRAARGELIRGVRGMLGRTLRMETTVPSSEAAILAGTRSELRKAVPSITLPGAIEEDGFALQWMVLNGHRNLLIAASNDRGVLYGIFALLRKIGLHEPIPALNEKQTPYAPLRWVNQWDNLDGTIERGYGGRSISFENDNVREDLADVSRLRAFAGVPRSQRLLHQQRQRQYPCDHGGVPSSVGPRCRCVPSLGCTAGLSR